MLVEWLPPVMDHRHPGPQFVLLPGKRQWWPGHHHSRSARRGNCVAGGFRASEVVEDRPTYCGGPVEEAIQGEATTRPVFEST